MEGRDKGSEVPLSAGCGRFQEGGSRGGGGPASWQIEVGLQTSQWGALEAICDSMTRPWVSPPCWDWAPDSGGVHQAAGRKGK